MILIENTSHLCLTNTLHPARLPDNAGFPAQSPNCSAAKRGASSSLQANGDTRSRTGVHRARVQVVLSFLESILFALIEQIGLATAQIHDLRATVSILLQQSALLTVVRVRNAGTSADHTPALIRAVVALITNSNQCARPHVRVTDHAFTIALLTEASCGLRERESAVVEKQLRKREHH